MLRKQSRPVWVLAAVLVLALFVLNSLSVKTLESTDEQSIRDRAQLNRRVDSLERRVEQLEAGRWQP
jgi:ABC-type cobalamin transport system ATPase subunit